MQKNNSKKWPKRLAIIILFFGLFIYVIFSPSDPNGIWKSHYFVAYADGTFAKLAIDNEKYRIGDEGVIFGEVRKPNPESRTCELYNNGKYFVSIKPYGPILLVVDSSSDVRGWGYRPLLSKTAHR